MNPSRINHDIPGSYIDVRPNFDVRAWLSSSGRRNPLHLMAGSGSGKSRLLGRCLIWHDLVLGIPQVVIDPLGKSIENVIDKLNRFAPDYERRFWERYKQPLTPEWIRYIDYERQQLAQRVAYVDMNEQGSFPLYYRLHADEDLFDMAQRFIEVIRRDDPALATASIEGFNTVYRIGTYAGMILAALGLQITEAEDLIRNPEQWAQRLNEALASYPEVRPAVRFFRKFAELKPEVRARGSESFLTKILAFSADPKMAVQFGASRRSLNLEDIVKNKQTVLLDFSKVSNDYRRRILLLWVFSEIFTFIRIRGSAGRQAPLGVVIDEITQLLGYEYEEQSAMASDIEQLCSVYARNHGAYLTIAHQYLSQVDERIQSALMEGNQIIGTIQKPKDTREVAEYFFRWYPKWVKKYTPVWMGIASDPFYDPVPYKDGMVTKYMDHVSTRTTPTIIDYTTEEFSIEEQLRLLSQEIQDLSKFNFLVRASGIEGQLPAPLRLLDISHIDEGIYLDEERVAEAIRRMSARTGFSKEQVLEEIKQRTSKPIHKKKVKTQNEGARLNISSPKSHDTPNSLPIAPDPVEPILSEPKPESTPKPPKDEDLFQ
jgi:hypothetical protein